MADEESEFERPRKIPRTLQEKDSGKRLILILEKASLETVKNGKNFELLNCDRHKTMMKKFKRDPALSRPDIAHQCLLMLLDSPLNKAGLLQVYVHTERNVLIEINPHTRIPRTFDRFCGLMVQLLHKLSIHAANGPEKLLKVIKNPVTDHLPTGCRKIGTSFHSDKLVKWKEIIPNDDPIVVVVGAMAHGSVDVPYIEESVAISQYPLSGALTCAKICTAFEEAWGVF
ncbi:ribosomal RNA small subunit methyltransferase NEP1-like [Acropora muricata]|uniref:ribosomal RNA small subunit methyltransferase NEP1-like n=1 Tax=Acropora millepora TaxID=45264 RepID=UPI0010FC6D08|nr:ribosomal RNA small subunit methyltransferase NEP1-like [Acropora millepora]